MSNSKQMLYEAGLQLQRKFLEINGIERPKVNIVKLYGHCGEYRFSGKKIFIDVENCAKVSGKYSFPGLFTDRTPYGVIQHETGHYIDDIYKASSKCRKYSGESPLTSYCPSTSEWFAEMFRLFVTNPDLLKRIRPKCYKYITDEMKLKPAITTDYEQTLRNLGASDYIVNRANNKINI